MKYSIFLLFFLIGCVTIPEVVQVECDGGEVCNIPTDELKEEIKKAAIAMPIGAVVGFLLMVIAILIF